MMAIPGRQRHADLLFGRVSGSVGLALALLPWPEVVTRAGGLGLLGILALIFAQPICGLVQSTIARQAAKQTP
jgi:hypothetical protein